MAFFCRAAALFAVKASELRRNGSTAYLRVTARVAGIQRSEKHDAKVSSNRHVPLLVSPTLYDTRSANSPIFAMR